jgi:hypothetical protein
VRPAIQPDPTSYTYRLTTARLGRGRTLIDCFDDIVDFIPRTVIDQSTDFRIHVRKRGPVVWILAHPQEPGNHRPKGLGILSCFISDINKNAPELMWRVLANDYLHVAGGVPTPFRKSTHTQAYD